MSSAEVTLKDSLKNLAESPVFSVLKEVHHFLSRQDIQAYIVGGLVRDMLLGRQTSDIDIAIAANAVEISPGIADAVGGKFVLLDKINKVARVVLDDKSPASIKNHWELDFSTFEGNIEKDLARRDFTVDAMAIELKQLVGNFSKIELIDPFHGWDDLQRRVIRVVSESVFQEDAVRLLRAVRLAGELGFKIEMKTEALIQDYSHLIAGVTGERIREEFLRILAFADAQFLFYMDKLSLLTAVFPELAMAKGVKQPNEHYWDVFNHSLNTVATVDFLLRRGDWEYAKEEALVTVPWSIDLAQHFDLEVSSGSNRRLLLKLAALLHDVAKPQTKALDTKGHMRFLGHGQEGAGIAAKVLERLRFSTKETNLVETLITYHLRPTQMSQEGLPTRRAIYRYFRDTGEDGIDILFLSLADHLATRGPNLNLTNWQTHTRMVDYVINQHLQEGGITRPSKIVDGCDIIDIFGVGPGPKVGEILEAVREAQASGEIKTKEEAIVYIRDYLLKEK